MFCLVFQPSFDNSLWGERGDKSGREVWGRGVGGVIPDPEPRAGGRGEQPITNYQDARSNTPWPRAGELRFMF